jgi:adenosylcobinamide-phosphate synthase
MESPIPFIVLFVTLLIDVVAGNIPGIRYVFALPLTLIRGLAGWFDRRLNREHRGRNARRVRGAIVLLIIAVPVWVGASIFDGYANQGPYGAMIDTCVLLFLIGGSRPIARLRNVNRALRGAYNERASRISNSLVRWDTENMDGHGIARAAISGGSARLAEGLFGLIFWYLLLGLPAVILYRVIGAIADVIGRNSVQHLDFGFAPRRLDDVLSLPAALIAGPVFFCAAIFIPQANPIKAFTAWLRDFGARALRSDFRGEGAIAGAFGIALGGPQEFGEETVTRDWIGDGRARIVRADVHRTSWLLGVSVLLTMVAIAGAIVFLKQSS